VPGTEIFGAYRFFAGGPALDAGPSGDLGHPGRAPGFPRHFADTW
jgi:hypothetical protein